MTSYLEQCIFNVGPVAEINAGLAVLKEKDRASRNILSEIAKEEADLLEELKTASKNGPDFDEEPLKARATNLSSRRHEVIAALDEQMKLSQKYYDLLDQKLTGFDKNTQEIFRMFPALAAAGAGALGQEDAMGKNKNKNKGRNKSGSSGAAGVGKQVNDWDEDPSIFDPNFSADPNEPKYCTCKRISFGRMVGCENPDCTIEWYHFGCVGLDEEPKDPWFCPSCMSEMALLSEWLQQEKLTK